jgi:hypothetical protein
MLFDLTTAAANAPINPAPTKTYINTWTTHCRSITFAIGQHDCHKVFVVAQRADNRSQRNQIRFANLQNAHIAVSNETNRCYANVSTTTTSNLSASIEPERRAFGAEHVEKLDDLRHNGLRVVLRHGRVHRQKSAL